MKFLTLATTYNNDDDTDERIKFFDCIFSIGMEKGLLDFSDECKFPLDDQWLKMSPITFGFVYRMCHQEDRNALDKLLGLPYVVENIDLNLCSDAAFKAQVLLKRKEKQLERIEKNIFAAKFVLAPLLEKEGTYDSDDDLATMLNKALYMPSRLGFENAKLEYGELA